MAQKQITDLTLRSDFDTTCNLAVNDSTQSYRVTGQQILDFVKGVTSKGDEITNLTLATSVASSALTVSVKTQAGANPSSTSPVAVAMRSSTLTSGVYNIRTITGALSMVVSSGSTLGQVSAQASKIYVYLIDNAGTLELAVSTKLYPEDALVSTTAEGGAGAADSATTIYSTTARASVPIRCVGYILNTQTTAGTWASAGTQIQLLPALGTDIVGGQGTVTPFVASGTFTTPLTSSLSTIYEYEMRGGGAGGGGGCASVNAGAGGGQGALARGTFTGIAPGTGIAVTINSGGGGGANQTTGTTGGSVVLGLTSPITCGGGVGGGATSVGGGQYSLGGIGGAVTGTPNMLSQNGIQGGNGFGISGTMSLGGAGGGGGSMTASTGAGIDSAVYGGGGGGGGLGNAGGAGKNGYVIIRQLTA